MTHDILLPLGRLMQRQSLSHYALGPRPCQHVWQTARRLWLPQIPLGWRQWPHYSRREKQAGGHARSRQCTECRPRWGAPPPRGGAAADGAALPATRANYFKLTRTSSGSCLKSFTGGYKASEATGMWLSVRGSQQGRKRNMRMECDLLH